LRENYVPLPLEEGKMSYCCSSDNNNTTSPLDKVTASARLKRQQQGILHFLYYYK
jgi:hypothetical protein